jgi:hypothetical protein
LKFSSFKIHIPVSVQIHEKERKNAKHLFLKPMMMMMRRCLYDTISNHLQLIFFSVYWNRFKNADGKKSVALGGRVLAHGEESKANLKKT